MIEKNASFRIAALITTPKLAEKAANLLSSEGIPVEHRISAVGTATSKTIDILGLGSIDKIVLFSIMPKTTASKILKKLSKELRLGTANSGIAFTIPLTGINNLLIRLLQNSASNAEKNEFGKNELGKEENKMSDAKYSIIAAMVNRGYSNDVMDAAREVGATGGSVINSRRIANEVDRNKWGFGGQEEKEIVFIVADSDNKLKIMNVISEKCGACSDAKGMVFSIPVDEVEGL